MNPNPEKPISSKAFANYIEDSVQPTDEERFHWGRLYAAVDIRWQLQHSTDEKPFYSALYDKYEHSTTRTMFDRFLKHIEDHYQDDYDDEAETEVDYLRDGFLLGLEMARHTIDENSYDIYMTQAFQEQIVPIVDTSSSLSQQLHDLTSAGAAWQSHYHTSSDHTDGRQDVIDEVMDELGLIDVTQKMYFRAGFSLADIMEETVYDRLHPSESAS